MTEMQDIDPVDLRDPDDRLGKNAKAYIVVGKVALIISIGGRPVTECTLINKKRFDTLILPPVK